MVVLSTREEGEGVKSAAVVLCGSYFIVQTRKQGEEEAKSRMEGRQVGEDWEMDESDDNH